MKVVFVKLAHLGTFDVENYGDLLFPLVVENELKDVVDEFVHVSPIGGKPYADVPASISFAEFARDPSEVDAVMVGGGNILHSRTTTLPEYRQIRTSAYPQLWVGAARIARQLHVPLIVNAPGARVSFIWPERGPLRAVLKQAAYFAVRDQASAARVEKASGQGVSVVPDTALRLASALPFAGQSSLDVLDGSARGVAEKTYIAVHINDRYLDEDAGVAARQLDRLAASSGLRICLLGIGPCHGDDILIHDVTRRMTSEPIAVPEPSDVRTIAHLIAGAAYYVGSSLHGFISATSYGVPAYLVTPGSKQHKFAGFIAHLDTGARLFTSWEDFIRGSENVNPITPPKKTDDGIARRRLDQHWLEIKMALGEPAPDVARRSSADVPLIAARNAAAIPVQRIRDRVNGRR